MSDQNQSDPIAVTLFSEVFMADQLIRGRLSKALPKGMELSHYLMLDYLSAQNCERTPVQLARTFNLTKGALTNTLSRLEAAGYIHTRPDWDDGRRKMVSISDAGLLAREDAIRAVAPVFESVMSELGQEKVKSALPFLRDLRKALQ